MVLYFPCQGQIPHVVIETADVVLRFASSVTGQRWLKGNCACKRVNMISMVFWWPFSGYQLARSLVQVVSAVTM